MPLYPVWVGCGNCGEIESRQLEAAVIQGNATGEVLRDVSCSACLRSLVIIIPPPWVLSDEDVIYLRCERIQP